jgi:hypothetical protein
MGELTQAWSPSNQIRCRERLLQALMFRNPLSTVYPGQDQVLLEVIFVLPKHELLSGHVAVDTYSS